MVLINILGWKLYVEIAGDGKRFGNAMRSSLWSQKVLHVGSLHATFMDSALPLLYSAFAYLYLCHSGAKTFRTAIRCSRAIRGSLLVLHTYSFQLCVSVSVTKVLAKPAQERCHSLGVAGGAGCACDCELVACVYV